MSKIRILPEQLANQIAAGEVVERPASVVKELLENSIDAGASRIEIEIEGGGTRLIRIIDDGDGMDEDDILLCLERHGTSKIQEANDLVSIRSLGFRGEAIPSIGSVSKMSIVSRQENTPLGTKVVYEYGKLLKVHEIGASRGTIFEIRNLFGNTPARRKFLRTVKTELGHIDEIIKNYALASPAITFILRINEKEVLHLDNNHSLKRRLGHLIHYEGEFIEIDSVIQAQSNSSLQGLIVPPEIPLSTSAKLRLFVNGRAVKDRMMAHAVYEGLRGFLMKGKTAGGYLHLHLPADQIDVNVHPAKHEIRFNNSQIIHEGIVQAIHTALKKYQKSLQATIFPKTDSVITPSNTSAPYSSESSLSNSREPQVAEAAEDFSQPSFSLPPPLPQPKEMILEPTPLPRSASAPQPPPPAPRSTHDLRIIGQFRNLYIFCQSNDGLVVIDQHAAHERLLFEKLRKQYLEKKVTSQTLLFPQQIELSLFQAQLLDKNLEEIERMGFTIQEFGGNSYIISAIPALAGQANPFSLLTDLLEIFGSEGERSNRSNRLDDILAQMACKAAVKSGDGLNDREIEALLSQMEQADLFSHCPHGRPVVKYFSENEIKKWFFRI